MEDYNYLSTYGDYGSPSQLIPKKTVDEITANAPKELDTFKEVADKISEIEGGSGSSADIAELREEIEAKADKETVDAKFEEIDTALADKADASALDGLATEDFVDEKIADLVGGAPSTLDTLKEIADALNDSATMEQVSQAISTKVDAEDFNAHVAENTESFDAINETLSNKADASALEGLATTDYVDGKVTEIEIPSLDGYVQDADYVHTDNNYTDEDKAKVGELSNYDDTALTERVEALEEGGFVTETQMNDAIAAIDIPSLDGYVDDAEYVHTDNNYTDEDKAKLDGLTNYDDTALTERVAAVEETVEGLDIPNLDGYVQDENYVHTDNNYTDEDKAKLGELTNYDDTALTERVAAIESANYVQDADYVHTDNNYTDEDKAKLGELENYDDTALAERVTTLENAGYLTTLEADGRYYQMSTADSIFIAKSQYEDDMDLKADKSELSDYTTDSELASAVHDLVVRLNKLEAQNAVLVEKGTESADDINAMTPEEAASADIVVATDEAIEALSEPKTFNSISIAGGEVGDNTVINLLATDSVDVNGLTVSGTKGSGNGKIVYGTNDITISNMNIEPGCTVYNVFEGKQDQASENCVENFTATNIVVNDTDLAHNVFNIYQFNDGANVLIKDSSFNLNVANSNVLRVSNITDAKNVTITFENVDWTYEEMGYTDGDLAWAGLMIYQPYGTDSAFTGDNTSVNTWTINVKNCRYNGKPITENSVGTIEQAVYQYNVNNSGISESPNVFPPINFE